LLLACTIGALLIPSASHDYTLSILAAPVAVLFLDLSSTSDRAPATHGRSVDKILVFVLSFLYSTTLFSFIHKTITINSFNYRLFRNSLSYNNLLSSNFIALMAMLFVLTLTMSTYRREARK